MRRRPDYGIDAPGIVRGLIVAAIVAAVVAVVGLSQGWVGIGASALVALLWCGTVVGAMLWTSKVAKLRERDRILDLADLEGDEVLLDLGCGRGLLLVEAAKRLPGGEAVGVDRWTAKDLSANTPAGALHNARLEGVTVHVETGDARELPFEDETFDAVVSSYVLHNIPGAGDRRRAVREIDRVLKPGGRLVLVDLARTDEYVAALRGAGWHDVERSERLWRLFPTFRYVIGTKP